jgi:predicted nucleic acid-binding protein
VEPQDVPAGPLAIDTDVFSYLHLRKGPYAAFAPLVDQHRWALPFAVIGELKALAYAAGSKWGQDRIDALDADIRRCTPIPSDARVVEQWAPMHVKLSGHLQKGGTNDLWVAACCIVHDVPLVTNNLGDFETIASEFPLRLVHPDL